MRWLEPGRADSRAQPCSHSALAARDRAAGELSAAYEALATDGDPPARRSTSVPAWRATARWATWWARSLNTGQGSGSIRRSSAPHEANLLHLQIDKAHHRLGWQPRWDDATTIERTVAWYRANQAGAAALECCLADLNVYTSHLSPTP